VVVTEFVEDVVAFDVFAAEQEQFVQSLFKVFVLIAETAEFPVDPFHVGGGGFEALFTHVLQHAFQLEPFGAFALEFSLEPAILLHARVGLDLKLDLLQSVRKLQGRGGFVEIAHTRGKVDNHEYFAVAEYAVLEYSGYFGVALGDVGPFILQGLDAVAEGRETLVDADQLVDAPLLLDFVLLVGTHKLFGAGQVYDPEFGHADGGVVLLPLHENQVEDAVRAGTAHVGVSGAHSSLLQRPVDHLRGLVGFTQHHLIQAFHQHFPVRQVADLLLHQTVFAFVPEQIVNTFIVDFLEGAYKFLLHSLTVSVDKLEGVV